MKMTNLIIFDFDDTIVDNSKLDFMGFKIPCKNLNLDFPTESKLKYYRKKGMMAKEIIQFYTHDDKKIIKFLKQRKKFLSADSYDYLKIKPYSKTVFQKLINSNNELIICTANNNPKNIVNFLKKNNLDHFFRNVYSMKTLGFMIENNDFGNRVLIKTSLLKFIIKHHKNSFKKLFFIGNSLEDYNAAKKLKINFIYFLNPYLPEPRIKNLFKINQLTQILNLIHEEKN